MVSAVGKFEVSNSKEKFESPLESCDGAECDMKMDGSVQIARRIAVFKKRSSFPQRKVQ